MNESRERACCECDYAQTRCVNESCVWHVNRKEIMICGQRPAGLCMRRCTRTTSKQLAERWAKGRVHYLSRPRLPRPVNCRLTAVVSTGVVNLARIDHQHDENDKMARLGENDGFQWRKGWGK